MSFSLMLHWGNVVQLNVAFGYMHGVRFNVVQLNVVRVNVVRHTVGVSNKFFPQKRSDDLCLSFRLYPSSTA